METGMMIMLMVMMMMVTKRVIMMVMVLMMTSSSVLCGLTTSFRSRRLFSFAELDLLQINITFILPLSMSMLAPYSTPYFTLPRDHPIQYHIHVQHGGTTSIRRWFFLLEYLEPLHRPPFPIYNTSSPAILLLFPVDCSVK